MKWLKAGVMEDGELHATTKRTPQGGIIGRTPPNAYAERPEEPAAWAQLEGLLRRASSLRGGTSVPERRTPTLGPRR